MKHFIEGEHTIYFTANVWNGLRSEMALETSYMKEGKGPRIMSFLFHFVVFYFVWLNKNKNL